MLTAARLPNGRVIACVAALCLLAFALGTYRLGEPSLGFDEGFSAYVARMSLVDGLRYLITWDAHPPGHYALLHYWTKLAGDGEFALRYVSAAFGVTIIPLLYQTGRGLLNGKVGTFAALAAASGALLTYHAQQARMYTMATVFALLALCLIVRTLRRGGRGSRAEWLGLLLATLLCLYTLYYTALLLLFVALPVLAAARLASRRGERPFGVLVPYSAVALVAAMLFLPWLPFFLAQASLTGPGAWRTFTDASTVLTRSWTVLALGATADPRLDAWLWLPVVALAMLALAGATPVLAALRPRQALAREDAGGVAGSAGGGYRGGPLSAGAAGAGRDDEDARRWLAAFAVAAGYILVPLALTQLASYRQPLYHERYVAVLLPGFALLMGLGLSAIARSGRRLLTCALIILLGSQGYALYNLHFDPRYAADDFRGMVRYVQENLLPGDLVLLSSGASYPIFDYYFTEREGWRGPLQHFQPASERPAGPIVLQIGTVNDVPGLRLSTPEDHPQTAVEVERNLARVTAGARRVWYLRIFEAVTDRRAVVRTWLERNLFETEMRWLAGIDLPQLYRYSTRRPPAYDLPPSARRAEGELANGVAIAGYELASGEQKPGELLGLTVYWTAQRPIQDDYQVFAHLIDRDGRKWAQFDGPPLQGRHPTSRWQSGEVVRDEYAVRLPRDLPAGLYHFSVGMYDLTTVQRVPVAGDAGQDAVSIGEIVVRPAPTSAAVGPVIATLGKAIALQEYRLSAARRGADLRVDLTWKALATPAGDYKVFVHLLSSDGTIVAQHDGEPAQGRFPTSRWRAGDAFVDSYRLTIPATAPPGQYRVALGMYDSLTLVRLGVPGVADSRLLLPEITVSGGPR